MQAEKQSLALEYREKLRAKLKPGDTLYTVLRSVSRSGMSRVIDVYRLYTDEKGEVQTDYLSYWIAKACGMTFQEKRGPEGIKVGGCGMDMGFHIVYELGQTLYPDGFDCAGKQCPSSDHVNGDRNREPHQHHSGGYAFRHKWL